MSALDSDPYGLQALEAEIRHSRGAQPRDRRERETHGVVASRTGMKMRQSLAELEEQFRFQQERAQLEQVALQRTAVVRSRQRWQQKEQRKGTKRFWLLAATLILTAVLVTVLMFATLYLLLV